MGTNEFNEVIFLEPINQTIYNNSLRPTEQPSVLQFLLSPTYLPLLLHVT